MKKYRWTKEEDEKLYEYRKNGLTCREIHELLPTRTISSSSESIFESSIKSLNPFLSFQTLATPRIIFLLFVPDIKFCLSSIGLNTFKSIPLCMTFTGYSFKKDFLTSSASQIEGVTSVKFFKPVKRPFLSL